ncbi:MAG: 50S ribosomal protein L21 [Bacteroidales bacterium]|jgi:large subunit ribosomal protein L21
MYAIVEIAGQQFKVEEGKKIFVHRLKADEGKQIDFDKVLLIEDEGKITIGEPVIKDAKVEGKVISQVRGDKVIVFKKKRKKGYRVKNGHRQNFTQVEIISINGKTTPKKQAARKESAEVQAAEPVEQKAEAKIGELKKPAARKTEKKKAETEKTPEKKPAAKKTDTKKTSKSK